MQKVAVHFPATYQAHDVQCASSTIVGSSFGMRARGNQSLIACKLTTAHCARDSHELLVNNPTSANVLMPNLTVAHHWLAILDGQSDIFTRSLDQCVWPLSF
jgi:hypothetical protein